VGLIFNIKKQSMYFICLWY